MLIFKRQVYVYEIVTENYKNDLIAKHHDNIGKIDAAITALDNDGRQFLSLTEAKDPRQAESFRDKLDQQIAKQKELKQRLSLNLAKIKRLEIGDKYLIDSDAADTVEINIGDNIKEKLKPVEVIIKDDTVIDIRIIDDNR